MTAEQQKRLLALLLAIRFDGRTPVDIADAINRELLTLDPADIAAASGTTLAQRDYVPESPESST